MSFEHFEQENALNPDSQPLNPAEPDMKVWQQWIAAALMKGCRTEEILSTLIGSGISEAVANQELELARNHPYIRAGQELNETLRKRDWVLNSLQFLKEMSPVYSQVDRRYKLSRNEFFEHYYFQNRPVIVNGLLEEWPAMTRWTPGLFNFPMRGENGGNPVRSRVRSEL